MDQQRSRRGSFRSQDSEQESDNALNLAWTFGFNKDIVDGVHNLSDDSRSAIFYVSAHTGVIYDYVNREQRLLQGHCNQITSCCVSRDKRWIVTADSGPESMIVVWDSLTAEPVKTIFDPHPMGVTSMDLSGDAKYLVTLSHNVDENHKPCPQAISVWEWTSESSAPLCTSEVEGPEVQFSVHFNVNNLREMVTNSVSKVIFWNWSSNALVSHSPPLSVKDFRQKVGNFTQSIFLPNTTQAITATVDGDIVLWDRTLAAAREDANSIVASHKRAVKIVKLNNHGAINCLGLQENLIVTGGQDGSIRFYDLQFRIISWFEDLEAGPVQSISFAHTEPHSITTINGTFCSPDFVVSTSKSCVVSVAASAFKELSPENRRGTLLVQGFNSSLAAVATHPKASILFAMTENGEIQAWDYQTRRLILSRTVRDDTVPTCLAMCPYGQFLVVGCKNGIMRILRWGQRKDLGELACFQIHANVGITQLKFSSDGVFLATADTECCVGLFQFKTPVNPKTGATLDINHMHVNKGKAVGQPGPGLEPSDGETRAGWTYIGRSRSHTAAITNMEFSDVCASDEGEEDEICLVSIAEDRTLVSYDIENSSVANGLVLKKAKPTTIEHGVLPTACLFHPILAGQRERYIITANDEYKLKLWNADNIKCRSTMLGPTYGGPINSMLAIPKSIDQVTMEASASMREMSLKQGQLADLETYGYLAYSTSEKVLGVIQLPFDGNPFKTMGLVAHPGRIAGFTTTCDGQFLVSIGGADLAMNLWSVNTLSLETSVAMGGDGIQPFLGLLPGGDKGELYQQIVDYFCYTQLKNQGEDSTEQRKIEGFIPIESTPDLMRALGYYPSEQEVKLMLSELKYSKYTITGEVVEVIDVDQFIKLYVNHRPVFGVGAEQIENAVRVVCKYISNGTNSETISWGDLKTVLGSFGDTLDVDKYFPLLVKESELADSDAIAVSQFGSQILGLRPAAEEQKQV